LASKAGGAGSVEKAGLVADRAEEAKGVAGSFGSGGCAIKKKIAMAARAAAMTAKNRVWKKATILIRNRRTLRGGELNGLCFSRLPEIAKKRAWCKRILWYL
jgi:hypothetical protein